MIIQGKVYDEKHICAICIKEFPVTNECDGNPILDQESIDFLGVKKGDHVCPNCAIQKILEESDIEDGNHPKLEK